MMKCFQAVVSTNCKLRPYSVAHPEEEDEGEGIPTVGQCRLTLGFNS